MTRVRVEMGMGLCSDDIRMRGIVHTCPWMPAKSTVASRTTVERSESNWVEPIAFSPENPAVRRIHVLAFLFSFFRACLIVLRILFRFFFLAVCCCVDADCCENGALPFLCK